MSNDDDTTDELGSLWSLLDSLEPEEEKEFWARRAANRGVKEIQSVKRLHKIVGQWVGNPLDDADDIDLCRWSEAPEVDAAVNALYSELPDTPEAKGVIEKKLKINLRMVVVDLYRRHLVLPDVYTRYSRNRNSYTLAKRYNPLQISYRPFIRVVDGLEKLGYIENHKGFYDRIEKNGRDSRMLPTPKLIKFLEEVHGFRPSMVTIILDSEVVRLKRADGHRVPYTDTPDTERMRTFLNQYNAAIETANISLELPEDPFFPTKERFDPTKVQTYRVFNEGSFDIGGRFYGPWWLGVGKENRKYIRINEIPAVECDYQAQHIHLLYSLVGMDYHEIHGEGVDPYSLPGYEAIDRQVRKTACLIPFNVDSEDKAVRAVRYALHKKKVPGALYKGLDLKALINAFSKKHEPIAGYLYSSMWGKLQNLDSKIAEYVLGATMRHGIVVLGIHDSFIVEEEHCNLIISEMRDAFHTLSLSSIPNISVTK